MRRHWSTYRTVGAWFEDFRGAVPIQQAAGIDRLMRARGLTFPEAYAELLARGAIVHVADPAGGRREGRAWLRAHAAGGPRPAARMTGTIETAYDITRPDPEFDPEMIAQAASEGYPEEEVETTDPANDGRTPDRGERGVDEPHESHDR